MPGICTTSNWDSFLTVKLFFCHSLPHSCFRFKVWKMAALHLLMRSLEEQKKETTASEIVAIECHKDKLCLLTQHAIIALRLSVQTISKAWGKKENRPLFASMPSQSTKKGFNVLRKKNDIKVSFIKKLVLVLLGWDSLTKQTFLSLSEQILMSS